MHLYAAFVPPAQVGEALAALVTGAEATSATAEQGPLGRRGLFARRTPEAAALRSPPQLQVLAPERLALPITDFGFVATGDARRLVEAITEVCAAQPPGPTVRISGGAALVDPDDRSVWADLAGSDDDLDALRLVADAVVSGVQPLGFFCDRRKFRARFPIATITEHTTVAHLEAVLASLAAYSSEPWAVTEIAVLQRGSEVWRTVPIGA